MGVQAVNFAVTGGTANRPTSIHSAYSAVFAGLVQDGVVPLRTPFHQLSFPVTA